MILFPIALVWVGVVLFWVIRKYNVDDSPDEASPDEPRRFPPRPPRTGGDAPNRRSRRAARLP